MHTPKKTLLPQLEPVGLGRSPVLEARQAGWWGETPAGARCQAGFLPMLPSLELFLSVH